MKLAAATKILNRIIENHRPPNPPCLAIGTKKKNRKKIAKHRAIYGNDCPVLSITTTKKSAKAPEPKPDPETESNSDISTPNRPLEL